MRLSSKDRNLPVGYVDSRFPSDLRHESYFSMKWALNGTQRHPDPQLTGTWGPCSQGWSPAAPCAPCVFLAPDSCSVPRDFQGQVPSGETGISLRGVSTKPIPGSPKVREGTYKTGT